MLLVGTFHFFDHGIKVIRNFIIFFSIERTLFIEAVATAEGKRLLRLALLVVIAESLQFLIVYRWIACIT